MNICQYIASLTKAKVVQGDKLRVRSDSGLEARERQSNGRTLGLLGRINDSNAADRQQGMFVVAIVVSVVVVVAVMARGRLFHGSWLFHQ